MKYPREAKVNIAVSTLNNNRRSSGDLSNESHRTPFHVFFGTSDITTLLLLRGTSISLVTPATSL
jgi:hypothetical protein